MKQVIFKAVKVRPAIYNLKPEYQAKYDKASWEKVKDWGFVYLDDLRDAATSAKDSRVYGGLDEMHLLKSFGLLMARTDEELTEEQPIRYTYVNDDGIHIGTTRIPELSGTLVSAGWANLVLDLINGNVIHIERNTLPGAKQWLIAVLEDKDRNLDRRYIVRQDGKWGWELKGKGFGTPEQLEAMVGARKNSRCVSK